jgi:hypothetical protein
MFKKLRTSRKTDDAINEQMNDRLFTKGVIEQNKNSTKGKAGQCLRKKKKKIDE